MAFPGREKPPWSVIGCFRKDSAANGRDAHTSSAVWTKPNSIRNFKSHSGVGKVCLAHNWASRSLRRNIY